MRAGLIAALTLAAASLAHPGHTHSMPNSTVIIDASRPGRIGLTVTIPISELEAAAPDQKATGRAGLEAFVHEHVRVRGSDQRDWIGTLTKVARPGGDHPQLRLFLRFTPAKGAAQTAGQLRYDAVIDQIASHYVLVYRREDGRLRPLSRLQPPDKTVDLAADLRPNP